MFPNFNRIICFQSPSSLNIGSPSNFFKWGNLLDTSLTQASPSPKDSCSGLPEKNTPSSYSISIGQIQIYMSQRHRL